MSTAEVQSEVSYKELIDKVEGIAKDAGFAGAERWAEEREQEKREFDKEGGKSTSEGMQHLAENFRKALTAGRPEAVNEARGRKGRHQRYDGGLGYKGASLLPFIAKGKFGAAGKQAAVQIAKGAGREDVTKALEATDYNAGGALLPEEQSADIIEALYASNVVRELGANTLDISSGNISLGKMNGTSQFYWIGEGASFTVSEQDFGEVKLTPHKGGVLVPISNDLLDVMPAGMESMIRDDMIAVSENGLDSAYIRGDGGSHKPEGILSATHADNKFNATDGPTTDQVAEELLKCMYLPAAADIPMNRPGWMFHPRTLYFLMKLRTDDGFPIYQQELSNGTLFGAPIGVTTQIPINKTGDTDETEIYFGDFSQVVIGDTGSVQVDESSDASFVDASGNTVHGFQEDTTLVRLKMKTDIAIRHNKAFGIIENADWGNSLG